MHTQPRRYFGGTFDAYVEAKAAASVSAARKAAALDKQKAHVLSSIAASEKVCAQAGRMVVHGACIAQAACMSPHQTHPMAPHCPNPHAQAARQSGAESAAKAAASRRKKLDERWGLSHNAKGNRVKVGPWLCSGQGRGAESVRQRVTHRDGVLECAGHTLQPPARQSTQPTPCAHTNTHTRAHAHARTRTHTHRSAATWSGTLPAGGHRWCWSSRRSP
jgi:hypothetical protein